MRQVYFLRRADRTGPIKIGCSRRVPWRCKEIGLEYSVLASAPGEFSAERTLHERFAAHRTTTPVKKYKGGGLEWFLPAPELLAFVEQVRVTEALPNCSSRNDVIAKRWLSGETLNSIGKDFGLSRQRIQQIVSSLSLRREWRNSKTRPFNPQDARQSGDQPPPPAPFVIVP